MVTCGKFSIQRHGDHLHRISLPVPLKGFDGFVGAWIYDGNPLTLVDVGPAVSAPHLLDAVSQLGPGPPELILLTHIHIDHAGGIGRIATAFPDATVVCHPKARQHLIDPQRLWQGSLKTLGEIAEAYGAITAVNARQIMTCDQFTHPRIRSIETPGHAAHHVSYLIDDLLFAGEAAGVHLPQPGPSVYLRPATPPVFFMETMLESIDRLIAEAPQKICYGHVGQRDHAVEMLVAHRAQLLHWLDMLRPLFQKADEADISTDVAPASASKSPIIDECTDYLLSNDPLLKCFPDLPPAVQARERRFIANSIRGYWGYVKS
jgi:glyoxylase-like metal-dependent hydrolase (beta-lactamase superfamily II)